MKGSLLLVDDEPGILESLGEFFLGEGYHVTLAASEEEALELYRAQRPAVVVSDLNLAPSSADAIHSSNDFAPRMRSSNAFAFAFALVASIGCEDPICSLREAHSFWKSLYTCHENAHSLRFASRLSSRPLHPKLP